MGHSLGKPEVKASPVTQMGDGADAYISHHHSRSEFDDFIQNRWRDDNTQIGQDASGLRHVEITVTKVAKLYNRTALDRYKMTKKRFLERYQENGNVFVLQNALQFYLGHILEEGFLPTGVPCLDRRINEVWLFHGTTLNNIPGIKRGGLNYRRAREDGLYGKWIYLTDSAQKADQYTGWYVHVCTTWSNLTHK